MTESCDVYSRQRSLGAGLLKPNDRDVLNQIETSATSVYFGFWQHEEVFEEDAVDIEEN